MPQVQTVQSQPVLLTIAQVAQTLGLSRSKVYQLIYYEGLPTVRFGRALYRFAFRGTNSIWAVSPCCTSLEICLSERELVLRVRYVALLQWLERREEVE